MNSSSTHVLVLPSYNTGPILRRTVEAALACWQPVWLFIDGSTDGAHACFLEHPEDWPGLRVFVSEENRGKGGTAARAADEAAQAGFTHLLLMDADGQHPAESVPELMEQSCGQLEAVVMGQPDFGPDAPWVRLAGRQLSIGLTQFETLWGGLADPLFGMRVYPVAALRQVMAQTQFARRYDFDPEVAVRLFWAGVPPVKHRVPVRYVSAEEGGVSHFHYLRDNVFMVWLHIRLLLAFLPRCLSVARLSRRFRRLRNGGADACC
ncbi:glycosyltransferase family 2 protein [Ruficoccus sp. ZRK36]|uniref:glycosyltransferase family 2 protein n=1 Tax=Ruficoccus sp. ZRK36 TaxID=2866311 RepID=UPI001C73BF13|nr:glycosyltransferase family 2 protein [Ruficoccus sp. ZRK36]QYY36224.1 glycosyltransferase family 2 protein [Ruficoccus sp. ZRK36]